MYIDSWGWTQSENENNIFESKINSSYLYPLTTNISLEFNIILHKSSKYLGMKIPEIKHLRRLIFLWSHMCLRFDVNILKKLHKFTLAVLWNKSPKLKTKELVLLFYGTFFSYSRQRLLLLNAKQHHRSSQSQKSRPRSQPINEKVHKFSSFSAINFFSSRVFIHKNLLSRLY